MFTRHLPRTGTILNMIEICHIIQALTRHTSIPIYAYTLTERILRTIFRDGGVSENINFFMAARLPDTSCAHEKVNPKYMKN
jgi:hypothetical protein